MITVRDISYSYATGAPVLKKIAFACERGTITGIIGPNGSGKTTLIKVMAGLLAPDEGTVLIDGGSLANRSVSERSREMTYVAQSEHIPFPFTAFEVVLMGRTPYRSALAFESTEDVAIAHEAMSVTETQDFAARSIFDLSGGERQRVVLARALAQQSKVMLLDEPTASLDIRHKVAFYSVLRRRCRETKLTAIAAMHDINLASLTCDRIVVIKGGRIVSVGNPNDVLTKNIISQVFETDLHIGRDPAGQPFVLPVMG